MSGQWHGGKGDGVRKYDTSKFNEGWDRIFGNKCVICGKPVTVDCQWSSCKPANARKELYNGQSKTG